MSLPEFQSICYRTSRLYCIAGAMQAQRALHCRAVGEGGQPDGGAPAAPPAAGGLPLAGHNDCQHVSGKCPSTASAERRQPRGPSGDIEPAQCRHVRCQLLLASQRVPLRPLPQRYEQEHGEEFEGREGQYDRLYSLASSLLGSSLSRQVLRRLVKAYLGV